MTFPPDTRTILVVDDDQGFSILVASALRENGYEVFTAASGTEALAWLKEHAADLILLDLGLPDMDGAEVTRHLRTEHQHTPFIVVSGREDGKQIVEMMRLGAHDYLIKSGSLLDLLPRVVSRAFIAIDRQRELDEAQRLLHENEARLSSALSATQDGIWEWWLTDDRFYFSARWKEMLGYLPDEIRDDRAEWQSRVHPEDLDRVQEAVAECLSGPRNRLRVEYRIRDKQGNYRWVLSQGLVHRDAHGNPVRLVGAVSDQTERLEMEMQLRQMQKMEAVGKLAGGVAHDFNNILATIQGHLWILEKGKPQERDESLNEIALATQRAASLTRQLLLFSRKQVMQPKDIDLNHLITGMGKMLSRSLGEDIGLFLSLSPVPALFHADPGMIEQILLNLAVNARDAMPKGGKITFTTRHLHLQPGESSESTGRNPGRYVCLQVEDTGCGIPEEIRTRVFEPFFTTKEIGKGTGLGLATVHGIVKQHQGWIELSSTMGKGTTFRLYFPACKDPKIDADEEIETRQEPHGTETIFLVEDDPSVRLPMKAFLSHLGYRVVEAASGVEAIALYDQNKPPIDLLLTDMVMPGGINGKDLAELMLLRLPGLRVIYTSGYDMNLLTPEMALKEGFNFLQKPVQPRLMARTIRNALDEGRGGEGPEEEVAAPSGQGRIASLPCTGGGDPRV